MKEENKQQVKQFNLMVPASAIERYKAIQQREGCNNYLEVFLGLIELYEQAAQDEDKKNASQ